MKAKGTFPWTTGRELDEMTSRTWRRQHSAATVATVERRERYAVDIRYPRGLRSSPKPSQGRPAAMPKGGAISFFAEVARSSSPEAFSCVCLESTAQFAP
jgi:cystathionine beta-lyase/cystathionine gamma-synthase